MEYIRERQAAYDRYNELPRNIPDQNWSEAAFAAQLDAVMGDNDMKRAANKKLALVEAMAEQREQRRHADWTKRVYEPTVTAIADAVDLNFARIHTARMNAYDGFLKATDPEGMGGGRVFLSGNSVGAGAGAYNPWELRESATVRVRVPVSDPLKVILDKRAREAALLMGHHSRGARSKSEGATGRRGGGGTGDPNNDGATEGGSQLARNVSVRREMS